VKFDVSQGAVAEHIAADADMHLFLVFVVSGQHFEKLLKFGFSC